MVTKRTANGHIIITIIIISKSYAYFSGGAINLWTQVLDLNELVTGNPN
jgi:hypothetical protein